MPKNKNHIDDQDIVSDMLKDSKFAITSLTVALEESSSAEYREILINQLNSCIDDHFRLSDFAHKKNWYKPNLQPDQQLQQDLKNSYSYV